MYTVHTIMSRDTCTHTCTCRNVSITISFGIAHTPFLTPSHPHTPHTHTLLTWWIVQAEIAELFSPHLSFS